MPCSRFLQLFFSNQYGSIYPASQNSPIPFPSPVDATGVSKSCTFPSGPIYVNFHKNFINAIFIIAL